MSQNSGKGFGCHTRAQMIFSDELKANSWDFIGKYELSGDKKDERKTFSLCNLVVVQNQHFVAITCSFWKTKL